jgi:hypothetical protein
VGIGSSSTVYQTLERLCRSQVRLGSGLEGVEGGGVTGEMVVFVAEAKKRKEWRSVRLFGVGLSLEHWVGMVHFFQLFYTLTPSSLY